MFVYLFPISYIIMCVFFKIKYYNILLLYIFNYIKSIIIFYVMILDLDKNKIYK